MSMQGIQAGQAFIKLAINDSEFVGGVNKVVEQIGLIDQNIQTFRNLSSGLEGATGSANIFNKALAFIAANPVTVAVIALTLAFKGLQLIMEENAANAKAQADHMDRLGRAAEDQTKNVRNQAKVHNDYAKTLVDLAQIENKNADQMNESRALVDRLNSAYDGLGLTYDDVTGKIGGLTEALKRMDEQQRKSLKATLENEQKNLKARIAAAEGQIQAGSGTAWRFGEVTPAQKMLLEHIGYSPDQNGNYKKTRDVGMDAYREALTFASANTETKMGIDVYKVSEFIPILEKILQMGEKYEQNKLELDQLSFKSGSGASTSAKALAETAKVNGWAADFIADKAKEREDKKLSDWVASWNETHTMQQTMDILRQTRNDLMAKYQQKYSDPNKVYTDAEKQDAVKAQTAILRYDKAMQDLKAQMNKEQDIIVQTTKAMTVGGFSGAQVMQDIWGTNTLQEQTQKATIKMQKDVHKIAESGATVYQ